MNSTLQVIYKTSKKVLLCFDFCALAAMCCRINRWLGFNGIYEQTVHYVMYLRQRRSDTQWLEIEVVG